MLPVYYYFKRQFIPVSTAKKKTYYYESLLSFIAPILNLV